MTGIEWGGSYVDCSFGSLPQCNATAFGRSDRCGVTCFTDMRREALAEGLSARA